jgi:predicted porin
LRPANATGAADWTNNRPETREAPNMKMPPVVAAIAACGLAAAAQAQSSASIYGLMDIGAGRLQAAGAPSVWRADSGNMTTSFLGFRGNEDLGGGLKVKFAIEQFLRVDTGAAGRFDGDSFWARNSFVGFEGNFGSSTLGRNTTPLFVSTLAFNALGDSFAFSPSIRHYFAGAVLADTGWNNSIRYISPAQSGVTYSLMANLGEGTGPGKNLSLSALYFAGPLGATAAWQSVRNGAVGAPTGFDRQTTFQFGASYSVGAVKLFGQYGQVKTIAAVQTNTTLYSLSAAVLAGGGSVLVAYGNANAQAGAASTTRKTLSLGYDYDLSKNTDLYAVYMNDKATALSPGNTFAAGIRARF